MTLELFLFLAFAGIAVLGAVALIAARHPIHSALALIVVMVALAALYLLLGAEFIAAVQIIVYAGAIMVLFIFVIMLLNAGEEERTSFSIVARYIGLPVAIFFTLQMAYWLSRAPSAPAPVVAAPSATRELSRMIFREFLLPFELTSILLLVAILGALVLARRES